MWQSKAWVGAVALAAAAIAGCGSSDPVGGGTNAPDTGSGGGDAGGPPRAGRTPNDGDSLYLNVLPPGANGNSAGGVGVPVEGAQLVYPNNFRDQLDLYGNLAYSPPNLKATPCTPPTSIDAHQPVSDLACNYFKREGLEPDTVVSEITLQAHNGKSVIIRRDAWGVPFVEGEDREAAGFGFGYAAAQDRLWLYDVLRQVGRGRFSEYLGPAPDTYGFDADIANVAGYSEAEYTAMIEATAAKFGDLGGVILKDLDAVVAGMNAYLAHVSSPQGLGEAPPEYASLAVQPGGEPLRFPPAPFTRGDIVASAVLIQAIFAAGGGGEASAVQLLQKLDPSFGPNSTSVPRAACEFWRDVRHAEDADTPLTIDLEFATQVPGRVSEVCPQPLPPGVAIWDPGSLEGRVTLYREPAGGVPLPLPTADTVRELLDLEDLLPSLLPLAGLVPQPLQFPFDLLGKADEVQIPLRPRLDPERSVVASLDPAQGAHRHLAATGLHIPLRMSNFLAVNADQTASGHPIAVMGPQSAYFVPQLLWEVAIKSNGGTDLDFNGRGVVFGNLPYINIGRGLDFAFSATSGGSDLVDIRVSRMCNLDGSPASRDDANGDGFPDADGYLVDVGDGEGLRCRAFYKRTDEWVAQPTVASVALGGPTGAETVRRFVLRTHYGPVFATATVNGEPVAISRQRTTFFGELDTALPFALVTTPTIKNAADFQRVFNSMTGTFNWIYVDHRDVGYIHSGLYPRRAATAHPELPVWGDGRHEWASDAAVLDRLFFANFGGSRPFPGRAVPVAQGDPRRGYFEWPGYLSLTEHPRAINPDKGWITSWNNRPAKGWWAADFNGTYGPTHRADMLEDRLEAFAATGRKHDIASMIEIMSDAAHTDLRGQTVLPLLLELMEAGPLNDEQRQVVALMRAWMNAGSRQWIDGGEGLGAYRRDRDQDGDYDQRAQVLLMDAWYPRLIDSVLPQLVANDGLVGSGRYDNPRAQGSAYQEGWFQHMKRVLEMALGKSATPYRQLRCADGTRDGCRAAVLLALDQALADLGGFANRDQWTGSPRAPAGGERVEDADAVRHTPFSFLPVPAIHWTNRPTFQQVIEIRTTRVP
ncbi:penicillin acylase family protein [Sinimarinibacterium thermocellulolyticum]|uniref:Penicillin acylase family protein n=1 Tax=Sinimarinibacterium thermocellulolyticum TaxID=3170016 RepID=A0ABV2A6D5_9GAMM